MQGVHLDNRISPILENGQRVSPALTNYLEAGCGFGGSCFPKDVKALISHGKSAGENMRLLQAVIDINDNQPKQVIKMLSKHYPNIAGIKIAILGLAFKPGTDDMRESPAIPIINYFLTKKALIKAFDPVAQEEAKKIFKTDKIVYSKSIDSAVKGVDVIILLTRWPEFEVLPKIFNENIDPPLLIDGRRMFNKNRVPRYEGIGN